MDTLSDSDRCESGGKPVWNLYQFGLSALCFISLPVLFKLPIDHYFGSGWTLLSIIIFVFILCPPIIYIQLRFGSMWNVGVLGIMDKCLPLGLIFTIGCFLRNFIHVIYTSAIITHCLSYIFFALFNCDGKLCIGGSFLWSSCKDYWAEGDCQDGVNIIFKNPTAEEKFYQNFVLMQSSSITSTIYLPDWFLYFGIITVPHLIAWILLFLIIIGGAKIFGYILYVLIPLGTILLTSVFIYILTMYANDLNQRSDFFNRFFTRFSNHVPVLTTSWDQYAFEPLLWGFLTTFAHLSIAVNLWNGVYPIMGKWIGYGKKRTHLSWIIIIIVFGSFVTIPTLLNVAVLSSSFSDLYLRCHVVHDWSFPFTTVAHIFTKFSTNKALVVAYYVGLLCFLLASEGFLLVASLETILDHLQRWHHGISNQLQKCYRIVCVVTILLSYFLSFTTILKTGYYWIYLMDFYVDRLMCLLMVGQCICFIVIYGFSKRMKSEGKILKLILIIFMGFVCFILFAVLIWFAIEGTTIRPTQDCFYERLDPKVVPIPSGYVKFGWFIAASPILLGLFIGPIIIYVNSQKLGSYKVLTYLLHGEQGQSLTSGFTTETFAINELNKQDTTKVTSLGKMQKMKDTLQSGPWQQASLQQSRDSSAPSAIYFNDTHNVMYDQRQSLRRPLISPEPQSTSSNPSQEYAKINKTKRRSKPDYLEVDV